MIAELEPTFCLLKLKPVFCFGEGVPVNRMVALEDCFYVRIWIQMFEVRALQALLTLISIS